MSSGARSEVPNRMNSATFSLPIDGRKVVGIVNYVVEHKIDDSEEPKVVPIIKDKAFWVKIKPTDSYLDRELRASGKMVSRLLQHNEPIKEIVDSLSQDSIIGIMVNYYMKNKDDIVNGNTLDKKIREMSTDPYRIKE